MGRLVASTALIVSGASVTGEIANMSPFCLHVASRLVADKPRRGGVFCASFTYALLTEERWMLSSRQLVFVWCRGRSLYVRTLFVGTRYTAIACAVLGLFLVRQPRLPVSSKVGLTFQNRGLRRQLGWRILKAG